VIFILGFVICFVEASFQQPFMFHKRSFQMTTRIWLGLLLVLALLIGACAAPVAPAADAPAAGGQAAAAPAPGGGAEFHSAWPYTAPPNGHFNSFVTNGYNLNLYHIMIEPPLFIYMWADASWMPVAGESWEWVDETTLRVQLREGAVWSDGSAFTSQDVIDTFLISRLLNQAVWRFISDVVAVDDVTVDFILTEPSTTVPRRILRETNIRASSTYGEWAQQVADLVANGLTPEDQEWKDLLQAFNEFRPEDMVTLGAFKIDPASITEAQMILNKVPTSFMADWVKFDRIVNYNGETPDVTPLVLAGDVDYATHGFPPATDLEFQAQGIRVIRAPVYSGPALYFNMTMHPFELKEFRQALAYAIDRDENATVAMAASGKRQMTMSGFSDNLAPLWLTEETQGALNPYDFDVARAEEILTGLGFTRDSDGVWLDDTGARMEFELTAPAEFADWSAAAENVAEQLTEFGIATTFRGVNFQQHPIDVDDGNFQLAIRGWGAGNPHPHFSYNHNFRTHNQAIGGGGEGGSTGSPDKPGMSFELVQTTDAAGEVDLGALTDAAGKGSDEEAQKADINTLALAYNELLPQIPLFERYSNNPAPEIRVTGWPPDDDPVYLNGPYADAFATVLLLEGRLEPVQ
jgi:peptide/nickel transport system substrate-binding protein